MQGLPDLANGKVWTFVVYMSCGQWDSENKRDRVDEEITFDEIANAREAKKEIISR